MPKEQLSIRLEADLLTRLKKEFPADATSGTITYALEYALRDQRISKRVEVCETLTRAAILMLSDYIATQKYPGYEAKRFREAERLKASYVQQAVQATKRAKKITKRG